MSASAPIGNASRARAVSWLAWIGLALACAWVVSRTSIVTDITAFLPGPASPAQAQLAEQLRDGVASRVVLIGIEGTGGNAGDSETLARVSQAMQRRLQGDAHFGWVSNGSAAALVAERERLFGARYLLSPQVHAGRFSEPGLRLAATELEALLRSSAAPLVKPFAARDPTGEMLALLTTLGGPRSPATQHDVWFDADGRTATLVATTRAPGFDIDAQAAARAVIRAAFAEAVKSGNARATLHVTGPGMFAVQSRETIQRDAERLAIAAAVLIAALLYAALRSGRLLFAAALPVGLGTLAGLAAVALWYGSIHGITLGFGMTLIGEAVDYAIYVQVQRRGDATDRGLWRTLWLAVLTSGAGFVAMMLSGFQGLVQLGLLSIVGIAVAAAVARTLLPHVLRPVPSQALARMRWILAVQRSGARLRWAVLALAAAAIALLAYRGATLWNDELAAISPLARGDGERDARLRSTLGLPDMRFVIAVNGATLDDALARAETLDPLLAELARRATISAYASPAQLVPSRALQESRRAALPDAPALRAALTTAFHGTALRATAFEPFVADVQAARAGPLLTPAYYAGTGLGERLSGQLRLSTRGATAFVTLTGVADEAALAAALRGEPDAALLDLKTDVESLVAEYRGKAMLAALGGALLIVLLLAAQLRDLRAAARIAVSLFATVAITAAALVVIENRLTLFHLVALLLVVGIGSNYALFFALPPAGPNDTAQGIAVPASVALCMASTLVAFALLATSATPVLHMIGLTAALGAAVSFLAAIAIAQPPAVARHNTR